MSDSVFVLGATLDPGDLRAFCDATGRDPAAVRAYGRAYLPDHEPAFVDRGAATGAVLVAKPRRGSAVAGALFTMRDDGALFDAKHTAVGLGHSRRATTVLTDDGSVHRVDAYACADANETFLAPTKQTLDMIVRGLVRFGHDASPVRAAALGRKPTTEPSSLFVYGTLRHGESRAARLEKHHPFETGKGVIHGSIAGRLVDLGDYPGLLVSGDRSQRAFGEIYTFADLDSVFDDLDQVEDFQGYDDLSGEYVRAIVRVDLDGRERVAWTYLYRGDDTGKRIIESGDWTRRVTVDANGATRPSQRALA
jgi:gamma-glutamylcyclotransferase (GGCT)/AIG2-like uncharacterized protein YtfP